MKIPEIFSDARARTELFSALIAGLCAGLLLSLVDRAYHPPDFSFYFYELALGVAIYPAVAILRLLWLRGLGRWLPGWLVVSVGGSFFFVFANLLVPVIRGWDHPLQTLGRTEYLAREISVGSSVVLVLVLLTLPVTALIQCRQELVDALKRWHEPPKVPSISMTTRD